MEGGMLLRMLLSLGLVLGLMAGVVAALRRYGARFGLVLPSQKTTARLAICEIAVLDAKHRLVLVRRDATEHVLVLGGAQPVLLETLSPAASPMKEAADV